VTLFLGREAHGRSFAKAVSWRITGTVDTFIISFILTGKATIARSIAAVELMTKIGLLLFSRKNLDAHFLGTSIIGVPPRLVASSVVNQVMSHGRDVGS
jgi:hypothetical protein